MAVLKHTSPTAWPSAPRPKPSSTVPSASTSSAVGLWSGQAKAFSVIVMSALHRRRTRGRQSRNPRNHIQIRIFVRSLMLGSGPLAAIARGTRLSDGREQPRSGASERGHDDAARRNQQNGQGGDAGQGRGQAFPAPHGELYNNE